MKAEFFRHEYTWSKHSIGGTIGLGITSSSTPKEKTQLREMEKLAAMVEPDSETGIDVEMLMYSVDAGFVKLLVKPVPAGEDQRQNKKVFLYQCKDNSTMDPSIYFIPCGEWESVNQKYIPPVLMSEDWDSGRKILERYQLMDRLPDLFRAVFWCVFRGGTNLAMLTHWPREDFSLHSREIMYAVHLLLPADLRKNAGYASYGCGKNRNSSFYFTDHLEDGDYFDLDKVTYHAKNIQEDSLDQFFYDTIATIYWGNEKLYYNFIDQVQALMKDRQIDKNMLKEVQWMFLEFCIQHMIDIPALEEIMPVFPQLFYLAGTSMKMEEAQNNLMHYYHMQSWSSENYEHYLSVLTDGFSKKGEKQLLAEMDWVLIQFAGKHKKIVADYLENLKKNKNILYTKLVTREIDNEESISCACFKTSSTDLSSIKNYVSEMTENVIPDPVKDQWMLRGIEILNADVFDVDHFKELSEIALILNRRGQWVKLLDGFLGQLREHCEELDDDQLDRACEIENIYADLADRRQTHLNDERKRRNHVEEKEGDLLETQEQMKEKEAQESENEMATVEDNTQIVAAQEDTLYRELDNHTGNKFLPFFVRGIPYGFLTGCILYLLNYAIVIGHWKISIGVGGMWFILMMNYATERIERKKKDGYRLWQALGLCIVEGYIIQTIAWLFLPKVIKVYFFLILGILTVLIQAVHGLILLKKRYDEEDA